MEDEEIQFTLNPEEVKKVSGAIEEIVNSMVRIKAEQELVKEICADLKEKYKIPLPISRKAATFILNESKQAKVESDMDMVDYIVELVK